MLKKQRRGQVSTLFALLMPIFLLFIGLALDLGWYYLNVSRLQNAADAAAVARAQTLISDVQNFNGYKSVALVDKYPAGTSYKYFAEDRYEEREIDNVKNNVVENYVSKNLSNDNRLVDNWTKSAIQATSTIYEKDDNFYYVVQLREEIRHFFLPGWFDDMNAPVTAVALLSKTAQIEVPEMPSMPYSISISELSSMPESIFIPEMPSFDFDTPIIPEDFKNYWQDLENSNVIVGNWEVQNQYKGNGGGKSIDPATGVEITEFEYRFGYKVYGGAWNHFQDFYNHYRAGDFYRTQKVRIKDDVKFTTIIKNDGEEDYKIDMDSYGSDSSVSATEASAIEKANYYKESARKTNDRETNEIEDTTTTTSNLGLPYVWKRLDSINVDFSGEVKLKDKWLSEDWDLPLGFYNFDDGDSNSKHNKTWDTTGGYGENDIKKLRIHTSINFNGGYFVRDESHLEKDEDGNLLTDVLWVRIESEPILQYPDKTADGYVTSAIRGGSGIKGLNSVNQIIINVNDEGSNTEKDSNGNYIYRPYIIFYDGPETNDIYDSYKSKPDILLEPNNPNAVLHRKSLPIIFNINAPFRAVLYAPNSPVVIIGESQNEFDGFIVAKEYMKLRTIDDFELKERRYYVKGNRTNELSSRKYYKKGEEPVEEPGRYYEDVYKLKDSTDDKDYFYIPADKNENEIEMFVDEHGDIATVALENPPKRIGTYNHFDRSDFTTHNYHVLGTLADNLLLSGAE